MPMITTQDAIPLMIGHINSSPCERISLIVAFYFVYVNAKNAYEKKYEKY